MRPKKVILYIEPDEMLLSSQRFVLRMAGFRVAGAGDAAEAEAIFREMPIDLVICSALWPFDGFEMVRRLKAVANHIPMMLLGTREQIFALHGADALLVTATTSSAELIERAKVMSARKRGPRNGATRKPPASEGMEAGQVAARAGGWG